MANILYCQGNVVRPEVASFFPKKLKPHTVIAVESPEDLLAYIQKGKTDLVLLLGDGQVDFATEMQNLRRQSLNVPIVYLHTTTPAAIQPVGRCYFYCVYQYLQSGGLVQVIDTILMS